MSYSISLEPPKDKCSECGREFSSPDCPDATYNLTPIFDFALTGEPMPNPDVSEGGVVILGQKTDRPRGLRLLNGRLAKETVNHIAKALAVLKSPERQAKLRELEPASGWGTLDGAVDVMNQLLDLATSYPEFRWSIR